MNPWLIISLIVVFLIALFNSKLSIWSVILKQRDIYKNHSTKKYSIFDYYVFFAVPLIFGVVMSFSLSINILIDNASTIITIVSIVAAVLLAFLGIIIDKSKHDNETVRQVVKETFITITLNIIYALIFIALVVVAPSLKDIEYLRNMLVGVAGYLIVKFVINILMVIKRIYKIIEAD